MKEIIRLTDLSRNGAAVKALARAIKSDASLRIQIFENGKFEITFPRKQYKE